MTDQRIRYIISGLKNEIVREKDRERVRQLCIQGMQWNRELMNFVPEVITEPGRKPFNRPEHYDVVAAMDNQELDIAYKKVFSKYLLQGIIVGPNPIEISKNLGLIEKPKAEPKIERKHRSKRDMPKREHEKYCPHGQHWVEKKYFYSGNAKDGLAAYCISCTKERRKVSTLPCAQLVDNFSRKE